MVNCRTTVLTVNFPSKVDPAKIPPDYRQLAEKRTHRFRVLGFSDDYKRYVTASGLVREFGSSLRAFDSSPKQGRKDLLVSLLDPPSAQRGSSLFSESKIQNPSWDAELNVSQRDAVLSLTKEHNGTRVGVFQGPPGTGKSTVIAATLKAFLPQLGAGTAVVITATSNDAVMAVLEKIAKADPGRELFRPLVLGSRMSGRIGDLAEEYTADGYNTRTEKEWPSAPIHQKAVQLNNFVKYQLKTWHETAAYERESDTLREFARLAWELIADKARVEDRQNKNLSERILASSISVSLKKLDSALSILSDEADVLFHRSRRTLARADPPADFAKPSSFASADDFADFVQQRAQRDKGEWFRSVGYGTLEECKTFALFLSVAVVSVLSPLISSSIISLLQRSSPLNNGNARVDVPTGRLLKV